MRKLDFSDLDTLIKLDLVLGYLAWSKKQWEASVGRSNFYYSLDLNNRGFILIQDNVDIVHLLKIVVLKSSRRNGVASGLMQELFKYSSKDIYLEVEQRNISAIKFYRSFGFESLHVAKNYYSNGENCMKMLLNRNN